MNATPENTSDREERRNGSSALRRSQQEQEETQHIPLVSGTSEEPRERADSGMTLGERLSREAERFRGRREERHAERDGGGLGEDRLDEPRSGADFGRDVEDGRDGERGEHRGRVEPGAAPADPERAGHSARSAGDDPNPPTGFVGAGPVEDNRTAAHQHVGSSGRRGPEHGADLGSGHGVERGAAAASGAGASAAPSQRRNTRYDDDQPRGLSGVGSQGTRPEPDFLNGFDDDEVGEYVPGQWDEPHEDSTRSHSVSRGRRSEDGDRRGSTGAHTASHAAVRPMGTETQAMPAASAAGLSGAAAVGDDEDRRNEEHRRNEDTPFLRREREDERHEPRDHRADNDLEYRNRLDLLDREKQAFGGLRLGTGFFGWLTAMGLMGLLGLIASAVVGMISYVNNTTGAEATRQLQSITSGSALTGGQGVLAAVVSGVILFLSFLAGGYVAGRMARFSGAAQGFGVWLWFIIVTAAASVAAVVGLSSLSGTGLSKWVPSTSNLLSLPSLIALAVVAVLSLVAALIGGAAGMRYHRRIDRADFAEEFGEDWQDR